MRVTLLMALLACRPRAIPSELARQNPFVRACTQEPCTCDDGFAPAGGVCRDIDECDEGTADCAASARCINLPGAFTCACPPGFSGDGRACTDLDECASGTALCSKNATCANTPGSYSCTCADGYSGDGIFCSDDDECAANPCRENEVCANRGGGFDCHCDAPFFDDGVSCRRYRAFVLDDNGSHQRVATILAAEMDVTPAPDATPVQWDQWDGVLPEPRPDVILWLQGWNYYSTASDAALETLRGFVNNGGGLVRTEWAAWTIAVYPALAQNYAEDLLPVGAFDSEARYTDANAPVPWRVLIPDHPIARGVPNTFSAKGTVVQLGLKIGAKAVFEQLMSFPVGPTRVPAVSYMRVGGGTVLHIDHDLLYHELWDIRPESIRLTEPDLRRVILNATLFAASKQGVVP